MQQTNPPDRGFWHGPLDHIALGKWAGNNLNWLDDEDLVFIRSASNNPRLRANISDILRRRQVQPWRRFSRRPAPRRIAASRPAAA